MCARLYSKALCTGYKAVKNSGVIVSHMTGNNKMYDLY